MPVPQPRSATRDGGSGSSGSSRARQAARTAGSRRPWSAASSNAPASASQTRRPPGRSGQTTVSGSSVLPGGADLDLGVHLRADAAVVARRPAAVLDLDVGVRVDGVLPVLPEPVLVQAGVQVVPGQHLGVLALADGEPVEVDRGAGQRLLGGGGPAVVGEVLAPAVEPAAVAPDLPR